MRPREKEYLAHIAALVKEDPSITVKEIAKKLQFADGKSVYYWLEQGNYRGLNQFKKDILTKGNINPDGIRVIQDGHQLYLLSLPFRSWEGERNEKTDRWFYFLHKNPNPRGLFAIDVSTEDYFPWFSKGDIIVVDSNLPIKPRRWILLKQGRTFLIGKAGTDEKVVDPHHLSPYSPQAKPLGSIIFRSHFF